MKNEKQKAAGKMLLSFMRQVSREKGISIIDIASATGLQRTNVNRMLLGHHMPSLDNFILIGEAVGVRLELHTTTPDTEARVRNINVPKFLFAPDHQANELYIMHTHYPACLIQIVQTTPVSLQVVENYDDSTDLDQVLPEALQFFQNHVQNEIEVSN